MSTFTFIPDRGASMPARTSVNAAKFGDGYEQRTPNGINSVAEDWDLDFTLRTKSEIISIRNFLKAAKGATSFDWTTPLGDALKFKCTTWTIRINHDKDASLSCKFEQVFEP